MNEKLSIDDLRYMTEKEKISYENIQKLANYKTDEPYVGMSMSKSTFLKFQKDLRKLLSLINKQDIKINKQKKRIESLKKKRKLWS